MDLTRCTNITADGFRSVAKQSKNLKELYIKECRIVNETISDISLTLHWLSKLDMRDCLLISTISDLYLGCPYLQILLVDGAEHLNGKILRENSWKILNFSV